MPSGSSTGIEVLEDIEEFDVMLELISEESSSLSS